MVCTEERVQQRVPDFVEIMSFVFEHCVADQRGLKDSFKCGDQNLLLTNDGYIKVRN